MKYIHAGHNPPVLLRTSAVMPEVLRWETGGTVIGLIPDAEYREGSFDLQAGDIAILFTDGVSESMNSQDEEQGEERLIAYARKCRNLSARETLDRIMTEAVRFASGAPRAQMPQVPAKRKIQSR